MNLSNLRDRRPDLFPRPKPPHVSTKVGCNRARLDRLNRALYGWHVLIARIGAAA